MDSGLYNSVIDQGSSCHVSYFLSFFVVKDVIKFFSFSNDNKQSKAFLKILDWEKRCRQTFRQTNVWPFRDTLWLPVIPSTTND